MTQKSVTKPTLGRLPVYLNFLQSVKAEHPTISATSIAKSLGYGEVQVRKDLNAVSGSGKPKTGYDTAILIKQMREYLGIDNLRQAVIVGAGKLGKALLSYDEFKSYGLEIVAAFDEAVSKEYKTDTNRYIYPMKEFESFCFRNDIKIGIITVPKSSAQKVCDRMVKSNISAIWSFAPTMLNVPDHIQLREENLALSLAYLNKQV